MSTDRRYDITDELVVPARADTVYRALVDELSGVTQWWAPDRTSELVSGAAWDEVGAVVATTVSGRWPVRFQTETVDVVPALMVRVRYVSGPLEGDGVWTMVEGRDGTTVSYRWRTSPRGWRRLLARFLPVAQTHSANVQVGLRRLAGCVTASG